MGLMGDSKAEGADQEGRAALSGEEEDDAVAQVFHETLLSGKLWKAVQQANEGEGGGVSPPRVPMHQNWATGCRDLPGEALGHACPSSGKPHIHSLRGLLGRA